MNKKYILFGLITICSITFMSCSQKNEKQITKKEAALSAIYNRKSVRSFIKDRPVSNEDVQALIKAGMSAPSGKDTRPWEFVIINDRRTTYSQNVISSANGNCCLWRYHPFFVLVSRLFGCNRKHSSSRRSDGARWRVDCRLPLSGQNGYSDKTYEYARTSVTLGCNTNRLPDGKPFGKR